MQSRLDQLLTEHASKAAELAHAKDAVGRLTRIIEEASVCRECVISCHHHEVNFLFILLVSPQAGLESAREELAMRERQLARLQDDAALHISDKEALRVSLSPIETRRALF